MLHIPQIIWCLWLLAENTISDKSTADIPLLILANKHDLPVSFFGPFAPAANS
jgi:hypothetical protein